MGGVDPRRSASLRRFLGCRWIIFDFPIFRNLGSTASWLAASRILRPFAGIRRTIGELLVELLGIKRVPRPHLPFFFLQPPNPTLQLSPLRLGIQQRRCFGGGWRGDLPLSGCDAPTDRRAADSRLDGRSRCSGSLAIGRRMHSSGILGIDRLLNRRHPPRHGLDVNAIRRIAWVDRRRFLGRVDRRRLGDERFCSFRLAAEVMQNGSQTRLKTLERLRCGGRKENCGAGLVAVASR